MLKTIKARCVNGALVPLEPVELRKGDEYLINLDVNPAPSKETEARLLPPGAWRDEDEYWESTKRMLYEARSAGSRTPPDP